MTHKVIVRSPGPQGATGPQGPQGVQGPIGPEAVDATTLIKGKVQLAGDLAGTAAAPTVPHAAKRKQLARNVDLIINGTITRDSNGAALAAAVTWPDGSAGTYSSLVVSATFPGAVDSYQVTYGSPVTTTYTQPTITRDSTGAPIDVPAIVES